MVDVVATEVVSRVLSACPFCASERVVVVPAENLWCACCEGCGAQGPRKPDAGSASEAWGGPASYRKLMREILDSSAAFVAVKDMDGRFLLANEAIARLMGTTPGRMVGACDADFVSDPELLRFYQASTEGVWEAGGETLREEVSLTMPDGDVRHYMALKKPMLFGPKKIPSVLIIANDVTDLKRANNEIAARERRYLEAMAASGEGIWEMDLRNNLISHNSHLPEIFGFEPEYFEVSDSFILDRIHPEDRERVEQSMGQFIAHGGDYESQHRILREDGKVIWVRSRGSVAEFDEDGVPVRLIGSIRDITQRKRAEASLEEARQKLEQTNNQLENLVEERTSELVQLNLELQSLARRDALTGLANRLAADEQLLQEYARFGRQLQPYTVMLVDVDHFKQVNDTFGHAIGDRALIHIAQLLQSSLRETDVVARYGGEEFLLLVHTGEKEALQLAEGIRRQVEVTPVSANLTITISIGVSQVQEGDSDATDALRRADKLLYQAKEEGRNCVRA